jgi:hypothetical protein
MTTEVSQRLGEINVDPKTVVLARKVEATSVGVPKPSSPLLAGTTRMKAVLAMGAQKIEFDMSDEIREEGDTWIITETAKTPMGEMSDVTILDRGALTVSKRTVKQGPATIEISFKDNKATGTMVMGAGQPRPISADVGGELFGDGAGAIAVIATLPLAEGYTTTFRNFDLVKQKPKLMQLKVVGVESVTVPAGTFDTFKCEVTSAEGDPDKVTAWIAKDTRKPVKVAATLSAMGGAVLTSELVP